MKMLQKTNEWHLKEKTGFESNKAKMYDQVKMIRMNRCLTAVRTDVIKKRVMIENAEQNGQNKGSDK